MLVKSKLFALFCALYMVFQGEPFAEEDFEEAILQVWEAIKKYNPETIGYCWDDTNPRIQLEPRVERDYIVIRAAHRKAKV